MVGTCLKFNLNVYFIFSLSICVIQVQDIFYKIFKNKGQNNINSVGKIFTVKMLT